MALPIGQNPSNSNPKPAVNTDDVIDVDAILDADNADKARESAILKKDKDNAKRGKGILFGGLGLALVGVVVAGFMGYIPFLNFSGDPTPTEIPTAPVETIEPNTPVFEEKPFWISDPFSAYPVKLEQWQIESWNEYIMNDDKAAGLEELKALHQTVADYNSSIPGFSQLQGLPARSNGFTDDIDKVRLEDGTLNPQYSYWTLEGFNDSVFFNLQRMVNPVFGNWVWAQMPEFDLETSRDLFKKVYDPEWFFNNSGEKPQAEWNPIFADWNNDDYGMTGSFLEPDGPRWMGVVESVEVVLNFDNEKQEYSADVTANVKYSSWGKTQDTVLEKNGTIAFKVVSGDETDKYMIKDSKLTINE